MKEPMNENEQLTNELKRLRVFTATIIHNIKTPLAGIKMLASLALESIDPIIQKQITSELHDAILHLQDYYRQLESIYKAGHSEKAQPEEVSLSESFDRTIRHINPISLDLKANIESDFSRADKVSFLSVSLDSVFLNLLSNALKYTKPNQHPNIKITSRREGKEVIVQCIDQGIGIDLDKYGDKMFKLFETFTNHPDATGMGLYIVKNQMESMGGSIEVASKVGEGTTFTLRFQAAH